MKKATDLLIGILLFSAIAHLCLYIAPNKNKGNQRMVFVEGTPLYIAENLPKEAEPLPRKNLPDMPSADTNISYAPAGPALNVNIPLNSFNRLNIKAGERYTHEWEPKEPNSPFEKQTFIIPREDEPSREKSPQKSILPIFNIFRKTGKKGD